MQTTGQFGDLINLSKDEIYGISAIYFGGEASGYFKEYDNYVTLTVPDNAAWGYVRLESQDRGITGYSSERFVPLPKVLSFTPTSGLYNSQVSIGGAGFSGVTGVQFNNLPCSFTVLSNTGILATVPTGNSEGVISVYGQSGLYARSSIDFTSISVTYNVYPSSARVGDQIYIFGDNYIEDLLVNTVGNSYLVNLNGTTGSFVLNSSKLFTGIVPSGTTTGPISAVRWDYALGASVATLTIIPSLPIISNVTPNSGKSSDSFFIYGSSFNGISKLLVTGSTTGINLFDASLVVSDAGDTLFHTIPSLPEGAYDLIIDASGGSVTGSGYLHILDAPVIDAFYPPYGVEGTVVQVSGRNLYPFSKIYFNSLLNEPLKIYTGSSDNKTLSFVTDNNFLAENLIAVHNSVNQVISTGLYRIIQKPEIYSFSPTSGQAGAAVSIYGTGFTFINNVCLNFLNIPSYTIVDDTGISLTIPNGGYDGTFKLTSSGGQAFSEVFNVLPPAIVVSGFTPSVVQRGDYIYVSGANLDTVTGMYFSGIDKVFYSTFNVNGSGILYTKVPLATREGVITLINETGPASSSSTLYLKEPPLITGIYPSSGIYGSTITISGSNFAFAEFYFQGVDGSLILGMNTSRITTGLATTQVPREIVRGNIWWSGLGQMSFTNVDATLFTPIPSISGIANSTGSTATGFVFDQTMVITGINASEMSASGILMSGQSGPVRIISNTGDFTITRATGINQYTIISGLINANFTGIGQVGLVSQYHTSSINLVNTGTFFNRNLLISETGVVISGFSPLSGGYNIPISISGHNLLYSRSVRFESGAFTGIATTGVVVVDNDHILVYPPTGLYGNFRDGVVDMFLATAFTPSGTVTFANKFLYTTTPTIFDWVTSGSTFTGKGCIISGTSFTYVTKVELVNEFDNSYKIDYNLRKVGLTDFLDLSIPADARLEGNTYRVKLTNPAGQSYSSSGVSGTILINNKLSFENNLYITGRLSDLENLILFSPFKSIL